MGQELQAEPSTGKSRCWEVPLPPQSLLTLLLRPWPGGLIKSHTVPSRPISCFLPRRSPPGQGGLHRLLPGAEQGAVEPNTAKDSQGHHCRLQLWVLAQLRSATTC